MSSAFVGQSHERHERPYGVRRTSVRYRYLDTAHFGSGVVDGAPNDSQSQLGSDILKKHVDEPHAAGWNGANARNWGSAHFLGFEVFACFVSGALIGPLKGTKEARGGGRPLGPSARHQGLTGENSPLEEGKTKVGELERERSDALQF
jgi:hypothetical protein